MTEYSLTLAKATSAALGLSKSVAIDVALAQPYTVLSIEDVETGPVVIAPIADFVGSVVSGNAPLTVNFTDLSTNTPTSWAWDFGDATTSTAQNPTKIYTAPGVYTVTLIATNSAGSDTEVKASYIVAAFNPSSLFTGGYTGGWYDASDLSTLWQNSARTTPVTADGDPVGAIDDKSGNGNHLIQATAGARPLYKTSGGLHWLEFDGIDDQLGNASYQTTNTFTALSCRSEDTTYPGGRDCFSTFSSNRGFSIDRRPTGGLSFYTGTGAGFNTDTITRTNTLGEALVFTGGYSGTQTVARINKGTRTTTTRTYAEKSTAGFTMGRGEYDLNSNLDGKWYGGLLINRFLTNTEQDDYVGYVGTKGGLSL